jgi:hypothetical protein
MPARDALTLALACAVAAAAPAAAAPVDAQIVLAVDVSASVDAGETRVQRHGYAGALRHPDVLRAITAGRHGRIALAYVEWAGRVLSVSLIGWSVIDGPGAAEAFATEVEALPDRAALGTSISRAIDFAAELIVESGVEATRRIIDVSGDGPNNAGPPVTEARNRAVAAGITVNGLPVLLRPEPGPGLDRYFTECVVGGDGAFVLAARAEEELTLAIRRKLVLEISGLTLAPRVTPASGGEPVDCLVGERARKAWTDRYFPGLYD